ncbi:O-antigen ligase family protein [Candidatus Sulfidibacterium hydrothermale]|uniref:O-antigen ligase family protein n=1 Tax=Candidatus Sulfidibacterium hydrothermale TaxID=2875962 RepID=UPI001F0ABDDF|nr:O-antigen ligase family protein [Candidatus Sulfidibacterium hydrothermale]UBM63582.1 O-antigen ligase family protein [Candidatus Sulfidibacterium hydrothermale]
MLESLRDKTGAAKLQHPLVLASIFIATIILGFIIGKGGMKVAIAFIILVPMIVYLNRLFVHPILGIYSIIFMAFVAIGLTRYIRGVPLGLSIDALMVLTIIAVFFRNFFDKIDFSLLNRDIVYLLLIWFAYSVLEFFNPQALSRTAWFYAMRGVSLYPLLLVPLGLLIFNRLRHLYGFLIFWAVFSLLATLKGLQQKYIGLDYAEQYWLDTVGAITHIINGKLRIFSFFSDAGQFGAAQGAAGIVFAGIAAALKGWKNKFFFWFVSIMSFWGMMISGTRGAMIVPALGGITFVILSKRIKVIITGGVLLALIYVFFAYTYIGDSNYTIARMRTAFHPEKDASYQVRLKNRQILKAYLADKPFGGGIGSAGNWGQRFSPQGFLANVATDSWYVQIWAEQGRVGLILHLFILMYIVFKSFYLIMARVKNKELGNVLGALLGGYLGIIGAAYGNGVLGQMPTGVLLYLSWVFLFSAQQLEREYNARLRQGISPWSFEPRD